MTAARKSANGLKHYCPKGVTFILTYHCNLSCPQCDVPTERLRDTSSLDTRLGIRVLQEARKAGINSFQVSGGEPTLEPDLYVALVEKAMRLGMRVNRPATNGFLGTRPEQAEEFFSSLRELGYRAGFRLSIDEYHAPLGPPVWAGFTFQFQRYLPLGSLSIGCCDVSRERSRLWIEKYLEELRAKGLSGDYREGEKAIRFGREKVSLGFWAPTRPTRENLPASHFRWREIPAETRGCLGPKGNAYLWIEPEGRVRVCAGNANIFSPLLSAGNLKEENLGSILCRIDDDPLYRLLSEEGVAGLRRRLRGKVEIPFCLDGEFTHPCELCYNILTDVSCREVLRREGLLGSVC